jgi:putative NADH-flavin reductase
MKLLVFGASGRCGQHFVQLAVRAGHEVTAVVRPSTAYPATAGVQVVRGDVLDPAFTAGVMTGHDAVMSGLGLRYTHPWAARRSPDDFISRATAHMVAGANASGLRRISVISAAGVGDSRATANIVIRMMIATSNVGVAYADLERVERILQESNLDWQAVRPTTLSNRRGTGRIRIADGFPMTASIAREDVAAFMLRELESGHFTARTPIITAG